MEPKLQAKALSVGYNGAAVIENVDFSALPGRMAALIGPNGAGKSTILKTLIRQLPPVSGAVFLENRDMTALSAREIARRVSAVLTGRPQPELMTCGDVVSSGRYPYTGRLGILSAEDKRIAAESMELVRVTELRDRDFNRISDGQRQRVLLARAICQEPEVLILDEPTSFLDIRHKLDFLYLLRTLAREKQIAVVLSLHELDLAQRFADTLLCIRDGRVDRCGTPEEIFGQPGYIEELYGIERGSYNSLFGAVESAPAPGAPRVFVIGGGGSGIPVYRKLQRLGIPFAAGVLPENDLDFPVAAALAAEVVACPAFESVRPEDAAHAAETAEKCGLVVCAAERFSGVMAENRRILDDAKTRGILLPVEQLDEIR